MASRRDARRRRPISPRHVFTALDGVAVSAWPHGRIGRDFFITTNGGLSWSAARQGRRFGGNWDDFDFVSQRTGLGWKYPGAKPPAALSRLFRTSDFGRIWTSFVPRLSREATNP